MDTEHDSELPFETDAFDAGEGLDMDEQISFVLTDMTLAEKVGQMIQLDLDALSVPGTEEIDSGRLREAIVDDHVGAVFNGWTAALTPEEWHDVVATIQEVALLETRLGIPIIFGIDSIHGANYTYDATLFPHNLGLAATWDPALVRDVSVVTARETAASGIPWVFAPVLDLGRGPLWPHFVETFGEDVVLSTKMGAAAVEGFARMSDVSAACAGHVIGHGYPLSQREATALTDRQVRDLFLPPLRAAVNAGVPSVLVGSGIIEGEPVQTSRRLLTGLLREELGFDGVVASHWEDVVALQSVHLVAGSEREAARLAIEAGIDLTRTSHSLSFVRHVCDLVEEGTISEERIDASVRRVLRLKHRLGLFDRPFPLPQVVSEIGSADAVDLSRKAASRGITLLKNEKNVLPLSESARLLVTGPASDSVAALHGPWSYTRHGADEDQYPEDTGTLASALVEAMGSTRVTHVDGIDWDGDAGSDAAVEAASKADVVIVCLGEAPSLGSRGDVEDLTLSTNQIDFARRLSKTGTPLVLVLLQDRPRIIRAVEPLFDAIVLGYRPGPEGGRALAAILSGKANPSGRLPFTYPRHPDRFVSHDHSRNEGMGHGHGVNSAASRDTLTPQFPFGFGLSYTRFTYRNLLVTPSTAGLDDVVTVSVDVKNAGKRAGREVVQLYVSDEFASLPPPVRRLKDFRPVELKAGESATIRFELPVSALGFTDLEGVVKVEPGKFSVVVADLSVSLEVR